MITNYLRFATVTFIWSGSVALLAAETPSWKIDSEKEWKDAEGKSENLTLAEGLSTPTAKTSTFSSKIKTYPTAQKPTQVILKQSTVWDNWQEIKNVKPKESSNAVIFLPIADKKYYLFAGKSGGKGKVKSKGRGKGKGKGKNKEKAEGKAKEGDSNLGYHAWFSKDMKSWEHLGQVTNSKWATTAEYKDGKTYIYYDQPNDGKPGLVIDEDLHDGKIGKDMGIVFDDPTGGSDCAILRDSDETWHLIYEDWTCIDAGKHSWDSPLAGHVTSLDGVTGFKFGELPPAVDYRTKPTGVKKTGSHPNYKYEYEVHSPEQDAYGDWTAINVGGQYYLFGDFHPKGKAKEQMSAARFTSSDINKEPFKFVGSIAKNVHPDPSIGFAEGKFYLLIQRGNFDYVSPGPWVDGVEVRVGVDKDGDQKIDQWTGWTRIKESYKQKEGFARVIETTPASLDLSGLPAGTGFQVEYRTTLPEGVTAQPIIDQIELSFK